MYQLEFSGFTAVTKKSAEPDSGEPLWQDMLQEQPNKFRTRDGFQFGSAMIRVVFVTEGHRFFGDIRNPAVADCCAVSITGEILNGVSVTIKGFFDERNPMLTT